MFTENNATPCWRTLRPDQRVNTVTHARFIGQLELNADKGTSVTRKFRDF